MEKDDEIKGEGNSYDFGARIYDSRISRWLSLDPLQAKYPNLSPYNFVANNPVFFVDPDGREISPTKEFLSSPWGAVYKSLIKNNTSYSNLISKYKDSKSFNLTLNYGDKKVLPGSYATTYSTSSSFSFEGKSIVAGAESDEHFGKKVLSRKLEGETVIETYSYTTIGMARTIIHEGVHSYIASQGKEKSDDKAHNHFNLYQTKMVEALTEYSKDNKLGLSKTQIKELSFGGTTDSKQFKKYINSIAKKNGTTYDDEKQNYSNRVWDLVYKLEKTETREKPKSEEKK